uniref:Uncharacterized protein n=1 Tax=viral metagenome TaxID=1070528 RepID=A0A6M3MHS4_9ZZZZ
MNLPILEVVELEVTKAPPEVYAMGTSVEVTVKNTLPLPWRYCLSIEYLSEGKMVDSQTSTGILMGRAEETIHGESSWSADLVRARVGTTSLFLLGDVKEIDP